jgi:hypothetical protein
MKKLIFLFFTLFMSLAVSAQKGEKLPEDDEKMLGYLTNLFEDQRKDYGKNQIEKKLSKMWLEENAFSQGQKNQFRATLNLHSVLHQFL